MSQKNKTQLQQTNNSNFPNNNSAFITPEKLRDFNQDIIDSVALDVDTELSGAVTLEGSLSASGEISASTYYGDGSNLSGVTGTVPSGTVSGSSQVILTDTSGNLGGNRITGSVSSATSASHAETADEVPFSGVTSKPTLVSGSSQITLEDTTYTDNGEFSFLQTDGVGNLSFEYVHSMYDNIYAGEDLVKGDPVYVSGSNGANPIVYKADKVKW